MIVRLVRSAGRTLPFVLCTLGAAVWAQHFELTRFTVDGGGATRTANGNVELSGTIGEPEAGALMGGPFTLTGGFWYGVPPGDCEEDGNVGLGDVVQLDPCMFGPGSLSPLQCRCLDLNRDSHVDLVDIALFQTGFTGP